MYVINLKHPKSFEAAEQENSSLLKTTESLVIFLRLSGLLHGLQGLTPSSVAQCYPQVINHTHTHRNTQVKREQMQTKDPKAMKYNYTL